MTEQREPPMTVKELSDYLRLDRMTIYKMLKEGTIPASRIGHQWRFFRKDIDDWIRAKRVQDLYTCGEGHETTEDKLVEVELNRQDGPQKACPQCRSIELEVHRGVPGQAGS